MTAAPISSSRPEEQRLRGVLLRMGAVSCFSVMAAAIKIAAENGANPAEILFYRNLFAMPVIVGWVLIGPGMRGIRTDRPRAHLTRAVIGLISMTLNFLAIAMLPLAEATAIGFTAPLFATILSALFLSETVGRYRWAAVLFGFVGVLVVVRPGSGDLPPVGVALGLMAAFGTAAAVVTIRQLGATESASATVFWFNLTSLLVMSLPMPFTATAHQPVVFLAFGVIGIFGGVTQILMTSSLRFAPVSVLAPFDYFQIIWAIGLGWLIWNARPDVTMLLGVALIAASGLYTVWRERRLHRENLVTTPTNL